MLKLSCLVLATSVLVACAAVPEGVTITDDERTTCTVSKDCTVWSIEELKALASTFFRRGYEQGKKAI